MKYQVLAGKCLQQLAKEAHISFILLSFIPPEVLFLLYKVYFLPLCTSPWQLETFSSREHANVRVCVLVKCSVIKQHYVMPQEMLAEDKHWCHGYLFSSYLIDPITHLQAHTHKHTHSLGKCAFICTHSIHDYMQVFMGF